MTNPRHDATIAIPPLPGWITATLSQTFEDAAFRSGAALGHLHLLAGRTAVPQALWRDRLALAAAEVCAGFAGGGARGRRPCAMRRI